MNQDTSKFRYVFTLFDSFTEEYQVKHKLPNIEGWVTVNRMEKFLTENSKAWSFQQEHSPTTKRLHFQGRFSLRKKLTKKLVLKLFLQWFTDIYQMPLSMNMHWLSLCTIQPEQDYVNSFKYVKKDDSRVPGTFRCYPPIYDGRDLEVMDTDNPKYFWQQQLDKIIKDDVSDRSVILVYDPKGGAGKTKWIKKQLFYNSDSIYVPIENTLERTLAALTNQPPKSLYLLDVPRGNRTMNSWYDLFKLCENLKNGMLTSSFGGKYAVNLYTTATVVVMTNFDIKSDQTLLSQLSSDRWQIHKIQSYPFTDERDLTRIQEINYNDFECLPQAGIR